MSTEERLVQIKDQFVHERASAAYHSATRTAPFEFDMLLSKIPTESPIERLLVAQMVAESWFRIDGPAQKPALMWNGQPLVICETQRPVILSGKRYRVDFMFASGLITGLRSDAEKRRAWVHVELDGHDFHERTKEQASADRKRDRDFASAGLTVVRFTGSDVYRDPAGVLSEIVSLAHSNAKARK